MPTSSACRSSTSKVLRSAKWPPCRISARATFWRSPGRDCNGVLVPFTKTAVPVVDLAARSIQVDSLAAGLAGDAEGDGEADIPLSRTGGFDPQRRPRGPRDAGGNR